MARRYEETQKVWLPFGFLNDIQLNLGANAAALGTVELPGSGVIHRVIGSVAVVNNSNTEDAYGAVLGCVARDTQGNEFNEAFQRPDDVYNVVMTDFPLFVPTSAPHADSNGNDFTWVYGIDSRSKRKYRNGEGFVIGYNFVANNSFESGEHVKLNGSVRILVEY